MLYLQHYIYIQGAIKRGPLVTVFRHCMVYELGISATATTFFKRYRHGLFRTFTSACSCACVDKTRNSCSVAWHFLVRPVFYQPSVDDLLLKTLLIDLRSGTTKRHKSRLCINVDGSLL